jgi:hypothetical protein
MRCDACIKSMSSENNNTYTNKQKLNNNYYENLNPFMMGVELWQTAATSWITTYNEFVKNASKMSEYWLNLFRPWSKVKERQDKVKVE